MTNTEQRLLGGYAQAGMFFSEVWRIFPEPLEIALRYASVDPNETPDNRVEREYMLATNWFFSGHRNKLTADIARVDRRELASSNTETRVRLQWDVSF